MTTTNAANSSPITAGDAVNTPNEWAPKRIWLQCEAGEGASHTWCEDSQAPEHEEASYIREDFTGTLSADYLSGHQDGLDWAALVVEYTDPRTGDWMYDDPHDLAKAIRKGPDMSAYQSAPTVPQQAGDVLTAMRERLFADIAALMDYTPSNPVVAEIRASLAAPRQPGEMGTGVQPGICPKCGLPNDELCAECPQPSAQQDERESGQSRMKRERENLNARVDEFRATADDDCVDRFAVAMKEKLSRARENGRSGWQYCTQDDLTRMLREHVEKGDPRDVANFCAFLWSLGYPIAQQVQADAGAVALLKRLKRDLMHARRFGSDTLQAFKSACSQAEGDIEEWLTEHRAAMSREQQENGGERG